MVLVLPVPTLPALLCHQAEQRGAAAAMRHKRRGIWQGWTWVEMREEVERVAGALARHGVEAGHRVAVVGSPRPQMAITLVALHALGAVPVLPAGDEPRQPHAMLHGVRLAIAADPGSADGIQALAGGTLTIVVVDAGGPERGLLEYDALLDEAGSARHALSSIAIDPALPAFIFGTADGSVRVLSHSDVAEQTQAAASALGVGPQDRLLQVAPFGREPALLLGPVLSLLCGSTLFFPESDETLPQDLREVAPTLLVAPSLLLRQLRRTAFVRASASRTRWRRFLEQTLDLHGGHPPPRSRVARLLGDIAVRRPVSDRIGLRHVRVAVTFGGAVSAALASFCDAVGVKLRPADTLIGIAPEDATDVLESELRGSLFIRDTVVARARDGARVALLFLDTEAVAAWAQTAGLTVAGTDTLVDMPAVQELVANEVGRVNERMPEAQRLGRFRVAKGRFTRASGEMTVDGRLRPELAVTRYAADLVALGAAPQLPQHAEAAA
jgi:long-subunit acyl-CoA synthetase (AMP-forming)